VLRVRELAQAAGYHHAVDLAADLPEISRAHLWRYWTGNVRLLNPSILQAIARRLGLPDWRLLLVLDDG
jgi:transcriptional regulator with XRE-family HTH domain